MTYNEKLKIINHFYDNRNKSETYSIKQVSYACNCAEITARKYVMAIHKLGYLKKINTGKLPITYKGSYKMKLIDNADDKVKEYQQMVDEIVNYY